MNQRTAMLLGLVMLMVNLCRAQTSQDTTAHSDVYRMIDHVRMIMQGGKFDDFKQYVSPEAIVISGKRMTHLWDILKGNDRESVLHEDSTRQGIEVSARSNKNEDAIYVTLKTVDARKEDPRYHSLVLYKEPAKGWQIFMWHVGM